MTPEQVQDEAVGLMAAAAELAIGLSENEDDYDLPYIARQLAKCSAYAERAGEMLSRLAVLKVRTLQARDKAQNQLAVRRDELEEEAEHEWKQSRTARPTSAAGRARELNRSLNASEEAAELRGWELAHKVLREVREEVGRRAETIKRMDSDLRLHQRVIEAKVFSGAIPRPGRLGDEESPGYRGAERSVGGERPEPSGVGSNEVDLD